MKAKSRIARILGRVLLLVIVLMTLLPFYLLVTNSFKMETNIIKDPFGLPSEPMWINYQKALPQIINPMIHSMVVAFSTIVITCFVSLLAAYAFARFQFFGKEFLYFSVIALLMIPGFVLLIPQFIQVVNLGLYDTYAALILVPSAYQVAMGTFLLRTTIEGISKSLFESAVMEGASHLQILRYIVLPMSKPTIATVTIMTGLSSWNNYIWPLVVSGSEETKQIAVALTGIIRDAVYGKGIQFAGYVCASLPIIILFIFANKSFIAGLSQGAVKG